jgi:epoxyqueuosine reductase
MLAGEVIEAARRLGFHRVALVPIEAPRRFAAYQAWLDAGHHGAMSYLAAPAHTAPRQDLRAVMSEARTLVVVALSYGAPTPPGALTPLRGRIARYARGEDYHIVLRDKLVLLADAVSTLAGRPVAARPCVDTAPLLEREWAERGGLGFVAKNTMVIAPGLGSYVLLGELLLDVDLEPPPVEPAKPRCGSCRACLDACPTGAFADAYHLDARRCISYLTIENEGAIPPELRAAIGTWIFGCDVCQEVCPHNAGSARPFAPELAPRDLEHAVPDLVALALRNTNQLRQFVKRTSMRRVGRVQLQRNVAVALGNTGDAGARVGLEHLLASASPLVRGHAAWGLGRLAATGVLPAAEIAGFLRTVRATEVDPEAAAEIDAAIEAALACPANPS